MRVEKQILSEVNRMREIMGLKLITEAAIPPAVRSYLMDIIGYTEKQIDALERGADDLSDLSKISDQFATAGIKTIDDLKSYVARNMGLRSVDDVSDQVLLKFMKETPAIMDNIQAKLAQKVGAASEALLKKAQWDSLVPTQLADDVEVVLNLPVTKADAADIKLMADQYLTSVRNVMTDINNRGEIVPQGLFDLADELSEVSKQADNVNTKMTADYSQVGVAVTKAEDDVLTAAEKEAIEAAEKEAKEVAERMKKLQSIDQLIADLQGKAEWKNLTTKHKNELETWIRNQGKNKSIAQLTSEANTEFMKRLEQSNLTKAQRAKYTKWFNNLPWAGKILLIGSITGAIGLPTAYWGGTILHYFGKNFNGEEFMKGVKGEDNTETPNETEDPNGGNVDNSLEPLPSSELEGLN